MKIPTKRFKIRHIFGTSSIDSKQADIGMDQIHYSKELRESILVSSGKKTATNNSETKHRNFSPILHLSGTFFISINIVCCGYSIQSGAFEAFTSNTAANPYEAVILWAGLLFRTF